MTLIPFDAAADGQHSRAGDFRETQRLHQIEKCVDFGARASDFEHERRVRRVERPGAEDVGEPHRL